jgi:uncharacterized protein DUF3592
VGGQTYEAEDDPPSKQAFGVGDTVSVRYSKDDPSFSVMTNGTAKRFGLFCILWPIMGMVVVTFGYLVRRAFSDSS